MVLHHEGGRDDDLQRLATPWQPLAGRFGLFARTGGSSANQWVDNVQIKTFDNFGPIVMNGPADLTVTEGQAAVADGGDGWNAVLDNMQWYTKRGVGCGGDQPDLYDPQCGVSGDNGVRFQFVAHNAYGSQQSRVATLTVHKDTQRPKLLYAVGLSPTNIAVIFSKP